MIKSNLFINPRKKVNEINPDIYGQFIEHFHRCVYEGIFDPASKYADEDGLRKDVLEAIRKLNVPNMRWPGGCYVSSYHWENGIGPVEDRPTTFDYAWRVPDTHRFGTIEFIKLCRKLNTEPYIATNAGTGSAEEAANWLEFCNGNPGTYYADQRVGSGFEDGFNVKYWSLGNENYGDWEIGAKTANEFSCFVTETAKMMRRIDPDVKLLAPAVYDYEWIKELLQHSSSWLDYLAIHSYFAPHLDPTSTSFAEEVSAPLYMEERVKWVEASIDALLFDVAPESKPAIAFDEWNLKGWSHYPPNTVNPDTKIRDQNDDNSQYTMGDAIFTAGFLNMLHRHADRVKLASFSPLVNVRGAIYSDQNGIVLRPTYHVFDLYRNYLGLELIDAYLESDTYQIKLEDRNYQVPLIEVSATLKDENLIAAAIINRSPDKTVNCSVELLRGSMQKSGIKHWTLAGDSADAYNDSKNPERVKIEQLPNTNIIIEGSKMEINLPAHSVNIVYIPFN